MTRIIPILEKLHAKQNARKQSEVALDGFIDDMLAIVRTELYNNGCEFKTIGPTFTNEGKEAQLPVRIEFPAYIYEIPMEFTIKIEERSGLYVMSTNRDTLTPLLNTPEQAADGFFAILNLVT